MPWSTPKSISVASVIMMAAIFSLTRAHADATITFKVPVKLQSIMDGVTASLRCAVTPGPTLSDEKLGLTDVDIPLTNGSVDTTLTVVVTPMTGKTFANAKIWGCVITLTKGNNSYSSIQFHGPTGGPDDWRYAKPGTPLKTIIQGALPSN